MLMSSAVVLRNVAPHKFMQAIGIAASGSSSSSNCSSSSYALFGLRADRPHANVGDGGGGRSQPQPQQQPQQQHRSINTSNVKHPDVLTKIKAAGGGGGGGESTPDRFPFTEPVRFEHRMKKLTRALSTVNRSVPLAANATAVSKDESRQFMAVFPDLVRDLTDKTRRYNTAEVALGFAKALQYNVPRGKKNRGLVTVLAYKTLRRANGDGPLSDADLRGAHYLGWCVEMLHSMLLITDDTMVGSATRRGQPCWYRQTDVGLAAINDALMIENSIYYILRKHFRETPFYVDVLELFHEAMMITAVGQSLDLQTAARNGQQAAFTMDRYKAIVHHKTAFYTFYLPVALAMHMAGYTDPEIFRQAKTILLEMGYFFQVQDDFLDCFGDPALTGKVGTDIQDNKCTWLAVLGMQRANDEQKAAMAECYGRPDAASVARVKQIYEDLALPHTFALYEEESYNLIKTHIQQTSRNVPHAVFLQIMDKIYRREC